MIRPFRGIEPIEKNNKNLVSELKKTNKDITTALTTYEKVTKKGDPDQIISAKTDLILAGTRFDLILKHIIKEE